MSGWKTAAIVGGVLLLGAAGAIVYFAVKKRGYTGSTHDAGLRDPFDAETLGAAKDVMGAAFDAYRSGGSGPRDRERQS